MDGTQKAQRGQCPTPSGLSPRAWHGHDQQDGGLHPWNTDPPLAPRPCALRAWHGRNQQRGSPRPRNPGPPLASRPCTPRACHSRGQQRRDLHQWILRPPIAPRPGTLRDMQGVSSEGTEYATAWPKPTCSEPSPWVVHRKRNSIRVSSVQRTVNLRTSGGATRADARGVTHREVRQVERVVGQLPR